MRVEIAYFNELNALSKLSWAVWPGKYIKSSEYMMDAQGIRTCVYQDEFWDPEYEV